MLNMTLADVDDVTVRSSGIPSPYRDDVLFPPQVDVVSRNVIKLLCMASAEPDLLAAIVVNAKGEGVEWNTSETKDDVLKMLDEDT